MRVYVAGPYTNGDTVMNVRAAIAAADAVLAAGHIPFVPHLNHLWHTVSPKPWEEWMRFDLGWLASCDAMVRLPGESKGADIEVAKASELGLPVFFSVEMWAKWVREL